MSQSYFDKAEQDQSGRKTLPINKIAIYPPAITQIAVHSSDF